MNSAGVFRRSWAKKACVAAPHTLPVNQTKLQNQRVASTPRRVRQTAARTGGISGLFGTETSAVPPISGRRRFAGCLKPSAFRHPLQRHRQNN